MDAPMWFDEPMTNPLGIEAYWALCRTDTGEAYITVRPSNEEET